MKKNPLTPQLRAMKKGEKLYFDRKRLLSIRSLCSNLAFQEDKQFSVYANKETKQVEVTCLS